MHKKITIAVVSVLMSVGIGSWAFNVNSAPQTVQASTKKYLKVKGSKKVRLYKSNGKKSKYYAKAKKKYAYTSKKYLKISGKKYLAYKIGDNSHYILAKNVNLVKSGTTYKKVTIKMPKGYTKSALLKAYKGNPSSSFIKASMKGMNDNNFSRTTAAESKKDNQTKVDPANLTASQRKELANFSLRLINDAREDLGLKPWVYSSNVEKLAQDIAQEYSSNNRGIQNGDHYVAGIVRACKKNGLNLDDNYVEDMAGFAHASGKMTMTELKKDIYFGLKQMIFGYTGSSEANRKDKNYYREWEHAGDLFNTQGSKHDGDFNYYGFSISKVGNVYSMHYISVPSFIIKSKTYNTSFKI